MSIINGNRIAQRLQSLWPISFVVLLALIALWVVTEKYPVLRPVQALVTLDVAILLALASSAILIRWGALQEPTIQFNNIREALNGGYISIITNQDDKIQEIADAVSRYLSQLGIKHLGHNAYVKHVVIKAEKTDGLPSLLEKVKSATSSACKLHLIIFPHLRNEDGEISIEYCLVNNGGQSVIRTDWYGGWHVVDCRYQKNPAKRKTTAQVARDIVGSLFYTLNLSIKAETPPASGPSCMG